MSSTKTALLLWIALVVTVQGQHCYWNLPKMESFEYDRVKETEYILITFS